MNTADRSSSLPINIRSSGIKSWQPLRYFLMVLLFWISKNMVLTSPAAVIITLRIFILTKRMEIVMTSESQYVFLMSITSHFLLDPHQNSHLQCLMGSGLSPLRKAFQYDLFPSEPFPFCIIWKSIFRILKKTHYKTLW